MPRPPARLLAVAVLGVALTGCATHDRPDRALDDCGSRIDARIESHEIPNADREYFIGMCQADR